MHSVGCARPRRGHFCSRQNHAILVSTRCSWVMGSAELRPNSIFVCGVPSNTTFFLRAENVSGGGLGDFFAWSERQIRIDCRLTASKRQWEVRMRRPQRAQGLAGRNSEFTRYKPKRRPSGRPQSALRLVCALSEVAFTKPISPTAAVALDVLLNPPEQRVPAASLLPVCRALHIPISRSLCHAFESVEKNYVDAR